MNRVKSGDKNQIAILEPIPIRTTPVNAAEEIQLRDLKVVMFQPTALEIPTLEEPVEKMLLEVKEVLATNEEADKQFNNQILKHCSLRCFFYFYEIQLQSLVKSKCRFVKNMYL